MGRTYENLGEGNNMIKIHCMKNIKAIFKCNKNKEKRFL